MVGELDNHIKQYVPLIKYLGLDEKKLFNYLVERMDNKLMEIIPKFNKNQTNDILLELAELVKQHPHHEQFSELLVFVSDSQKSFQDTFIDGCFDSVDLFLKLSLNARRILWKSRPSKFGENLLPYVNAYVTWLNDKYTDINNVVIRNSESSNTNNNMNVHVETVTTTSFLSWCYGERRKHQATMDILVNLIGDSFPLYNLSLQFIRTLWIKTKEISYCSLRLDLLLVNNNVNTLQNQNIRSADPCYKLVWYLDTCITANHMKKKYLLEIHNILKLASKNKDFVLGDIGMILSDPSVKSFLLTATVKRLEKDFQKKIVPRDCTYLSMIITLLKSSFSSSHHHHNHPSSSTTSLNQDDNINTKIRVTDHMIFTQLLPILMYQLGFQYSLAIQVKCCELLPSLKDFFSPNSPHFIPIFDVLFSCEMSSYVWWYTQIFLLNKFENWEMFMWMVNEYVDHLSQYCFLQIETRSQFDDDDTSPSHSTTTMTTVCFFSEFVLLMIIPLFIKLAKLKDQDNFNWFNFFDAFFIKIPNILIHNRYRHTASNILNMGIKMLSIIGKHIPECIFNEISDMIAVFAEEIKL